MTMDLECSTNFLSYPISVNSKLVELGYSKEDIAIVRGHAEVKRAVALSDSSMDFNHCSRTLN